MFVVSDDTCFRPLKTSELHFESIILQLAPSIFPEWRVVRWKKRVFTPEGRGVEPDLLLLSRVSREWVVVEVELESHSVSSHIEDQLDRLSRANYGLELLPSFVRLGISEGQARQFLLQRPSLLCIVDKGSLAISNCCQAHGFDVAVMGPYSDEANRPGLNVLSLPGQYRRVENSAVVDYVYVEAQDRLLGQIALMVPANFPSYSRFSIRVGSETLGLRVVALGDARLVFPQDSRLRPTKDGVLLSTLDIDKGIFCLVEER